MLSRLLSLSPARALARMLRAPRHEAALNLHGCICAAARRVEFHLEYGVPDTIDGRFDLLTLHAALVFRALWTMGAEGRSLAQATCDVLFAGFDDAVRALGVGDMGVPRKVKAMAAAYQGRAQAYGEALDGSEDGPLAEALRRNLFRAGPAEDGALSSLAAYARATDAALKSQPIAAFAGGSVIFPAPWTGAR